MREIADLADRGGAQVRDLAILKIVPDLLHGIELRRVGRQELDLDFALLCFKPSPDEATAMRVEPVPDDEKLAPSLRLLSSSAEKRSRGVRTQK